MKPEPGKPSHEILKKITILMLEAHEPDDAVSLVYAVMEGKAWDDLLKEREADEVRLSEVYRDDFNHGTGGHQGYLVNAKLATMLSAYEEIVSELVAHIDSSQGI